MQPCRLPLLVTLAAVVAMLVHGPIAQFADYHHFADTRPGLGLANAADVLSNLGFLLVGTWGLWRLAPRAAHPALAAGWPGYRLFLVALVLTAFGSAWYHLAPDDSRLIWDRLPIALACAGLLGGVAGETTGVSARRWAVRLSLLAAVSVAWWHATGDLRAYLLLQALPLLLIPLWQAIHRAGGRSPRLRPGARGLRSRQAGRAQRPRAVGKPGLDQRPHAQASAGLPRGIGGDLALGSPPRRQSGRSPATLGTPHQRERFPLRSDDTQPRSAIG